MIFLTSRHAIRIICDYSRKTHSWKHVPKIQNHSSNCRCFTENLWDTAPKQYHYCMIPEQMGVRIKERKIQSLILEITELAPIFRLVSSHYLLQIQNPGSGKKYPGKYFSHFHDEWELRKICKSFYGSEGKKQIFDEEYSFLAFSCFDISIDIPLIPCLLV